jgi:hypothetical protein
MLCNLALRRSRGSGDEPYSLRINGKTSRGPSDTGGSHVIEWLNADAVRSTLQDLGMTADVLAATEAVISDFDRDFLGVVDA